MDIAHECLANVNEDIKPLLEKHWELVALNQGAIKLNPDWEKYAELDAAGILRIFTARDQGKLVGYCVLVVSQSMHYKDHVFANNDVVFVLPDSRAGATGNNSTLVTFIFIYNIKSSCSPYINNNREIRRRFEG